MPSEEFMKLLAKAKKKQEAKKKIQQFFNPKGTTAKSGSSSQKALNSESIEMTPGNVDKLKPKTTSNKGNATKDPVQTAKNNLQKMIGETKNVSKTYKPAETGTKNKWYDKALKGDTGNNSVDYGKNIMVDRNNSIKNYMADEKVTVASRQNDETLGLTPDEYNAAIETAKKRGILLWGKNDPRIVEIAKGTYRTTGERLINSIPEVGNNAKDALSYLGKNILHGLESAQVGTQNMMEYITGDLAYGIDESIAKNAARIFPEKKEQFEESIRESNYHRKTAQENINDNTSELQKKGEKLENEKPNFTDGVNNFIKLAGQSSEMLPTVLMSAVNPLAGTAYMASEGFGRNYGEALNDGANPEQATKYAISETALEVALEKLLGNKLFGGQTVTGSATDKAIKKIVKNKTAQNAIMGIIEHSGEGVEEVITAYIEPLIKKLSYSDTYDAPGADEVIENFFGGFIGSAAWSGIGHISNGILNKGKSNDEIDLPREESVKKYYEDIDLPTKEEATGQKATTRQEVQEVMDSGAETGIEFEKDYKEYPYNMKTVIKDYVNYSNPMIRGFVEKVMGENATSKDKIFLNHVRDRAANDIKNILGVDVSGYKVALDGNTVRHIVKRHGLNDIKGEHDDSMSNLSDWEKMQYVLENYDNIEYGGTSTGYTTIKENGQPKLADTVVYSKKINGTYYVVEAVPVTNAKTLRITSAYIGNKNEGAMQPSDVSSPEVTSETQHAHTPSVDNISQSENIVNSNDMQNRITLFDNVPSHLKNAVNSIRNKTGLNVRFANAYNADGSVNNQFRGFFGDNTIVISQNATRQDLFRTVAIHELTHSIENTKQYSDIESFIINKKYGGDKESFNNDIANKISMYSQNGVTLTESGAKAEIVADSVGEYIFADDVQSIVEQDYTFGQKVYDLITDVIYRLQSKLGVGELDELKNAQRKYRMALENVRKNGTKNTSGQYDIYDMGTHHRVVVTNDIVNESNVDTPSKLKDYIKNNYDKIKIDLPNNIKGVTYVTERGASEYAFSEYTKRLRGTEKYDKYRMADNIDELIKAQIEYDYEDPKHSRNDDIVGFYRSPIEAQVGTRLYDCELVTGITRDGKEEFYDVVNLNLKSKNEPHPTLANLISIKGRRDADSSNDMVSQKEPSVNTNNMQNSKKNSSGQFSFATEQNPETGKFTDVSGNEYENVVPELEQFGVKILEGKDNTGKDILKIDIDNPDVDMVTTSEEYKRIIENAFDIKEVRGNTLTAERAFEKAFGKYYEDFRKVVYDILDRSKLQYMNVLDYLTKGLNDNVIKRGIKKGSKDSELMQKYGEGLITQAELMSMTDNWQNIVEADRYIRKMYDALIDSVNETKKKIYPYIEEQETNLKNELAEVNRKLDLIEQGNLDVLPISKSDKVSRAKFLESSLSAIEENSKHTLEVIDRQISSVQESMDKKRNKDTKVYVTLENRLSNLMQ